MIIDGDLLKTEVNTNPVDMYNYKIYASSPGIEPFIGEIKKLQYSIFQSGGTSYIGIYFPFCLNSLFD